MSRNDGMGKNRAAVGIIITLFITAFLLVLLLFLVNFIIQGGRMTHRTSSSKVALRRATSGIECAIDKLQTINLSDAGSAEVRGALDECENQIGTEDVVLDFEDLETAAGFYRLLSLTATGKAGEVQRSLSRGGGEPLGLSCVEVDRGDEEGGELSVSLGDFSMCIDDAGDEDFGNPQCPGAQGYQIGYIQTPDNAKMIITRGQLFQNRKKEVGPFGTMGKGTIKAKRDNDIVIDGIICRNLTRCLQFSRVKVLDESFKRGHIIDSLVRLDGIVPVYESDKFLIPVRS